MLRFPLLILLLLPLIMAMSCPALAEDFPAPGTTFYPMQVGVLCTIEDAEGFGIPWYMEMAPASCTVSHGPVGVNEYGYRYIDFSIGPIVATGVWKHPDGTPYGPATLTVSSAAGRMTSYGYPEGDFPAESFFDVYTVTIDTPIGTFASTEVLHMVAGPDTWSWYGAFNTNSSPLSGGGPYDTIDMFDLYFDQSLVPIPEPSGLLALASGLVPLGLAARRRRSKS